MRDRALLPVSGDESAVMRYGGMRDARSDIVSVRRMHRPAVKDHRRRCMEAASVSDVMRFDNVATCDPEGQEDQQWNK